MKIKYPLQLSTLLLAASLSAGLLLTGCGTEASLGAAVTAPPQNAGEQSSHPTDTATDSSGSRETVTDFLMPQADGAISNANADGTITIDASHTENGYLMVQDLNDVKVQIQITNPDGTLYPYPLVLGSYQAFPLTGGDGTYQINVLEQISGDTYAIGLSQSYDVQLLDEFQPFLYPNQYVGYTGDSAAVSLAMQESDRSSGDLNYVQNVYNYVIDHISYDNELAANTPTNYIPNVDATLSSGKGICFDYAALMTAMLRSQKIPTRLEVGYSGDVYHAWISVYLKDIGWVDNIISFDGKSWTLMDPTLGANNSNSSVKDYVGDGSNYTTKYKY